MKIKIKIVDTSEFLPLGSCDLEMDSVFAFWKTKKNDFIVSFVWSTLVHVSKTHFSCKSLTSIFCCESIKCCFRFALLLPFDFTRMIDEFRCYLILIESCFEHTYLFIYFCQKKNLKKKHEHCLGYELTWNWS